MSIFSKYLNQGKAETDAMKRNGTTSKSAWKNAFSNAMNTISSNVDKMLNGNNGVGYGSSSVYGGTINSQDIHDVGRILSRLKVLKRFHLGNDFGSESNNFVFTSGFEDPTYLTFKVEFGEWGATVTDNSNIATIQATSYGTNVNYMDYDQFPMGLLDLNFSDNRVFSLQQTYNSYNYLRNRNQDRRAEYLKDFVEGLYTLQRDFPYVFQKISGLDKLSDFDATRGQRLKDCTLKISCLQDGIDQKIRTLFEYYRKAAWNDVYQRWELPDIQRFFKMIIYIYDERVFHVSGEMDASQELFPIFALECSPCEFVIKNETQAEFGANYFDNAQTNPEIEIKVGNVKTYYCNQLFQRVKFTYDLMTKSDHQALYGDNVGQGPSINWRYNWMARMFMLPDEYDAFTNINSKYSRTHYVGDLYDQMEFPLRTAEIEQPNESWHFATVADHAYIIDSWGSLWNAVKDIISQKTVLIRDSRTNDKSSMRNDLARLDPASFEYHRKHNMNRLRIDVEGARVELQRIIQRMIRDLKQWKLAEDLPLPDQELTDLDMNVDHVEHKPQLKFIEGEMVEQELTDLDMNLEKAEQELTDIEMNLDKPTQDLAILNMNLDKPTEELAKLNMNLDKLQQELIHLLLNLDKNENAFVELEMNLEKPQQELIRLLMNLDKPNQVLAEIIMNLDNIAQTLTELDMNLDKPKQTLAELIINLDRLHQELIPLFLNLDKMYQTFVELDIYLAKPTQSLVVLQMNLLKATQHLYEIRMNIDKMKQELKPLELNLDKEQHPYVELEMNLEKQAQELYPLILDLHKMYQTLVKPILNLDKQPQELTDLIKNLDRMLQDLTPLDMNLDKQHSALVEIIQNLEKQIQLMNELDMNLDKNQMNIDIELKGAEKMQQELVEMDMNLANSSMNMTPIENNVASNSSMYMQSMLITDKPINSSIESGFITIETEKPTMQMVEAELKDSSVNMTLTEPIKNVSLIDMSMDSIHKPIELPQQKQVHIEKNLDIPPMQFVNGAANLDKTDMTMTRIEMAEHTPQPIETSLINNDGKQITEMVGLVDTEYHQGDMAMNPIVSNDEKPKMSDMRPIEMTDHKQKTHTMPTVDGGEYESELKDVRIVENLEKANPKMTELHINNEHKSELADVRLNEPLPSAEMKMPTVDGDDVELNMKMPKVDSVTELANMKMEGLKEPQKLENMEMNPIGMNLERPSYNMDSIQGSDTKDGLLNSKRNINTKLIENEKREMGKMNELIENEKTVLDIKDSKLPNPKEGINTNGKIEAKLIENDSRENMVMQPIDSEAQSKKTVNKESLKSAQINVDAAKKLAERIDLLTQLDTDSLKTASIEQMNNLIGILQTTINEAKREMRMYRINDTTEMSVENREGKTIQMPVIDQGERNTFMNRDKRIYVPEGTFERAERAARATRERNLEQNRLNRN